MAQWVKDLTAVVRVHIEVQVRSPAQGSAVNGSSVATATAQIQFLAQELHVLQVQPFKKKKDKDTINEEQ